MKKIAQMYLAIVIIAVILAVDTLAIATLMIQVNVCGHMYPLYQHINALWGVYNCPNIPT